MDNLIDQAAEIARQCLSADPALAKRWRHVQGVAACARDLRLAVPDEDRNLLIAAAWLHDIGYTPSLIKTGMHALDGAIYLQSLGLRGRLVALVAHHTGARFEAAERGLIRELEAFEQEDSPLADAITTADLTIGPNGQPATVTERIAEILTRYPDGSAVHRAMARARETLIAQVDGVRDRLTADRSVTGQ